MMNNTSFLEFYTATPKFTHEPGLHIMRELMTRLGDPQRGLKCVHIAGTNGKGSCAAMTAAVLRAAGYRTGLFTSPDLLGMEERIRVDEVNITSSDFARITARVKTACEDLPAEPSYFEKITAAAFLYFAEQGCDRVVLETGMGGRLDATNVIETPLCSVIMPIGFDHTAVLGDTLSAIAGEKAGIIKPGCPVICAPQAPEALAILKAAAKEKNAPFHLVDINLIRPLAHSPAGQVFSYGDMEDIFLPLLGAHQLRNAAVVLEAARQLCPDNAIRTGLKNTRWPCRFEYIGGEPPFLLDGAHNAHGAAALAAGLRDYFPGARFIMIMGVMADKDYSDILSLLIPLAKRFVCTAPDSPRALPAAELAAKITTVPAEAADSMEDALALAKAFGDPVCAFGSLYYIGALRALLLGD